MGYGNIKVVRVFIPQNSRLKAHLIHQKTLKRKSRAVWHHLFTRKKAHRVRTLLGFRVGSNGTLRATVKRLEFLSLN